MKTLQPLTKKKSTQKGTELVLNHVDIYFVSTCRYRFKVLLVSVDKMWSGKWGS